VASGFGKDHAQTNQSMIPKMPAPDVIRGGIRFSGKIMRKTRGAFYSMRTRSSLRITAAVQPSGAALPSPAAVAR
jgi:hypothetical protein